MSSISSNVTRFVRSRRRAAGVIVACLALGIPAVRHAVQAHETGASAASVFPLALRFEPGTLLRYRVAWSGEQRGRLFAANDGAETHTTTTSDMALGLALFVESVAKDEATLVLSFTDVARCRLDVLGAAAFPSQKDAVSALTGHHARVRIGTDGVSRDVAFEQGTPDVFMNVVQWVVAQSNVSLGPSAAGSDWDGAERGPFGASRVHYRQKGEELSRSRTEYTSFDAFTHADSTALKVVELRGNSQIRVRGGAIDFVRTEERVRVDGSEGTRELDGNVRFELALVRVDRGHSAPVGVAYGEPSPAGEPVVGPETLAELLDQRVDGLTREQMLSDLRRFGNGGLMPQHTRWLWRATGVLKKDPKLAAELSKLALGPQATDKARTLVMDLLASVGHAEAQAAMREILASPLLARSPLLTQLVQRVSFLDAPAPETVDAVWDSFRDARREGNDDLAYGSAYALAATSGAAAANGDAPAARAIVGRLAGEVARATDPESRAVLIGALGNARSPEIVAIAKPYATSETVALREAAADALRKVETREATGLLLDLVSDNALSVQTAALASLRERSLGSGDWSRIAGLMSAGRLDGALDGTILTLASSGVGVIPQVKDVIAYIAARPQASAAIRARARAMLEQAG